MKIVHTSQGVFIEVGDELIVFGHAETQRIFGIFDENEGFLEELKQSIINKYDEHVSELRLQFSDFGVMSVEPAMAYIGAMMNYRTICEVGYREYREQVLAARNG